MLLSNPAKIFIAGFLILLTTTSCGWLRSSQSTENTPVAEPKSRLPFKTKEPESFQCDLVETAGGSVRRTRLARKGSWHRIDYDLGEPTQRAVLRTDKEYLIDTARGVYAERPAASGDLAEQEFTELTHELLSAGGRTDFEEIGREGTITKYRAVQPEPVTAETVTYFDESIGLPVKQEVFSVDLGERTLEYTVELTNCITEPDAGVFAPPQGVRKVTLAEFYKLG